MFLIEQSRRLLAEADVFFGTKHCPQDLNLNDVFAWGVADGEDIPDDDLPRVAELFWRNGWCGILYWVSERREQCRSEFADINRAIDFVRAEEAIRTECPDSNKRAYLKRQYVIGGD